MQLWPHTVITKNNVTTVPHPAYSLDLGPCDFYVFPKMKLPLKVQRFLSIEEIQGEPQQVLNTLTPADLNECFQKWQTRWDRCIQAQGDYYEGDGGNWDLKEVFMLGKGKAVPLQAWSGPDGSRKLRFPDFMTTAQDSVKVVSLTHRPPLPPGNVPGTYFC